MSLMKINKELPQKRCEICHKADFYDPQVNLCERCENINYKGSTEREKILKQSLFNNPFVWCGYASLIVGLISGAITTTIDSYFNKYNSALVGGLLLFTLVLSFQGSIIGKLISEHQDKGKWIARLLILLVGVLYSFGFVIFISDINHLIPLTYLSYAFYLCILNTLVILFVYENQYFRNKLNKLISSLGNKN